MKNKQLISDLCNNLKKKPLKDLFIEDKNRVNKHNIILDDLLFDYSKNYINDQLIEAFIDESKVINFKDKQSAMFRGDPINFTEHRSVLHVALRDKNLKPIKVGNKDYYSEIWQTFERMTGFAEKIRSGELAGYSNKPFTDVVNIGIGGSSLPVEMAYKALLPYKHSRIKAHFVSNVDGSDLSQVLSKVNPATTLFLIASKTFTTSETIMNAQSAKSWLVSKLGERAVDKHFVALSTNLNEVAKFGINSNYIFGFWDFIGGRYSLWSSIGLSLVISIGKESFEQLLNGAKSADMHFKEAPLQQNIPFIMAILSILYRNFWDFRAEAVLPYSNYLELFPNYLQQVSMESNGKTTNKEGLSLDVKSSPILFGGAGTNSQHSFFQLLHQGSDIIPLDFIGVVNAETHTNIPNIQEHQETLIANLIAQSEALMVGKSLAKVKQELSCHGLSDSQITKLAAHKVFVGNRPSNMLLLKRLNPYNLGLICALYEHKYFVQGMFWDINSYDQWGVELGKQLATVIIKDLKSNKISEHDGSTVNLIKYYNQYKNNE